MRRTLFRIIALALLGASLWCLHPSAHDYLSDAAPFLAMVLLLPLGWAFGPWASPLAGLATFAVLALERRPVVELAVIPVSASVVVLASGLIHQRLMLYAFRERAFRLLGATGKIAVKASSERRLMQKAVRLAVEEGGYRLAAALRPLESPFPVAFWVDRRAGVALDFEDQEVVITYRGRTLILGLEELREVAETLATVQRERRPLILDNALLAREEAWRKLARFLGFRAAVAVAVATPSYSWGVLWVANAEPGSFSHEEIQLLEEVGQLLATALERMKLRSLLEHQALTDLLTGLLNRRGFRKAGEVLLAEARAEGRELALLYLDLDRFKQINDTLGHGVGDQVLAEVGRRIKEVLPPDALVGRLGGDEFAILLPGDETRAREVALELVERVSEPLVASGETLRIGASVGIAFYPRDARTLEELVRKADIAMYQAKRRRTRVAIYEPKSDSAVRGRVVVERQLVEAIQKEAIEPYYQPVVNVHTGEVLFFEALARWHMSPTAFIPVAEEAGLAFELDRVILKRVLADLARWREEGLFPSVSVNISPVSLNHPHFLPMIHELILSGRLPADRVVIEVTEAAFLQPEGEEAIRDLHNLGIRLAVDDFGTGYSSIARVRDLPIDYLKVPKEFISNVTRSATDAHIASAIRLFAAELGFEAIAEGVEREDQVRLLKEMGFIYMQGYYFARPLSAGQAVVWLKARQRRAVADEARGSA